MGILDGVDTSLLNNEGRKNISLDESRSRFIYLCPKHFELGVGTPKTQRRLELAQLDHPIGEQGNENDNNNGNADDD